MDKTNNNFEASDTTTPDVQLDDLDINELRDRHPELALKLEEHQQETGYE
jgi:hypothetical protein